MRFKMTALVAAVSFTLPVAAQTTDPAAPAPKKEKKICRRLDQTGSILGSRPTCHTKDEWAKIDAANADRAGKIMDDTRSNRNRGVGGL